MRNPITNLIRTGLALASLAVTVACSSDLATNPVEPSAAAIDDQSPRQLNWLEIDGTVLEIDYSGRTLRLEDSRLLVKIHEDAAVYYDDNRKPLGISGIFAKDRVRLLGEHVKDGFLASVVIVLPRDAKQDLKTQ